jgi:hypothetical protein
MFSKNFNTWMGKDLKIRSQNWGGNGRTGGKFKFAKSTGKIFGILGKGLSVYSMYNSYNKWTSCKISSQLFIGDMASGLFGVFGGIYGASLEIGWYLGKNYGFLFEEETREPLIFESEGWKEYIENNP